MTPSTFLANFRHVVNAPLGVSRLREMVYALAVSGSLCPQRPDDGTGHRLLEQINAEKESRIQKGVFKRSPKLEGAIAKYSDTLPRIPGSWAWSRLLDLGEINPRNDADDDILAAFAPMNAISELHNGPIRSEDRKWGSIKKGFTHFADGDVMVAKITPCFENGKGAVLRGLTNGIGAGTTELHVVRPLPGVLPAYIYVFLRSPHFKTVGESHMTGTAGQKRLSTEYFALREFPLPPLEEQKRIVAKVDELMRLCDRLEAQQQEREKLLPLLSRANHTRFVAEPSTASLQAIFHQPGSVTVTDLRQTIRDLAIRGRLVDQRPTDTPVETLLEQIVSLKSQSGPTSRRSLRNSTIGQTASAQFDAPDNWAWVFLGDVVINRDGERIPVSKEEREKRKKVYDYYGASGIIDKIDAYLFNKPLLLIGEDGANLINRSTPIAFMARGEYWVNNHAHVLDGISEDFLRYIELFINAINLEAYVTGTAQPKMNQAQMNRIPIAIPPIEEQIRIVAKVDELMRLCDRLESLSSNGKTVSEAFARSAIAAIASTEFTESERMKPPKTEVVTALKVGTNPKNAALAPLAALLAAETSLAPPKPHANADGNLELTAKELWQISGLEIDAFYRQLKTEMANGWIEEDDDKRAVKEVEAR